MLIGTLLLLGAVSLLGLPLDLLPELNLPVAVVLADFPGAAPSEVEELLTRPLEEALVTVPRLEHIHSYSRPGSTYIIMQFDWGTAMDFALLDAREKLDMVQPFLPEDATSPRLIQADPNLFPVMQVLIYGSDSPVALRSAALETVKPRLERVPGVAVADVLGGAREEVHVTVDPLHLLTYGLTPGHLEHALRGAGLDLAAEAIGILLGDAVRVRTVLGPEQGRLRARFYSSGWVEGEQADARGTLELALRMPLARARRLAADGLRLAPMDARARGLLAAS